MHFFKDKSILDFKFLLDLYRLADWLEGTTETCFSVFRSIKQIIEKQIAMSAINGNSIAAMRMAGDCCSVARISIFVEFVTFVKFINLTLECY